MRYLLIVAVLFLVGMLLSVLPSRRQMRLARLRQQAMRDGIQVRVHNTGEMALLQGQVAYFRPLKEKAEHWRLLRIARLNSREMEQGKELSHVAASRIGMTDWMEEGQVPVVSEQARQKLRTLLAALPEGVDAVGIGALGAFVIWDEKEADGAQEAIAEILQWLEMIA